MSGQNFEQYVDAWAQMMVTIWAEKMAQLGIGDTKALEQSLRAEVIRQAGGDTTKINHFFLYYGHYVARGVGKEFKKGNAGNVISSRKAKPWLSGKYWYSKNKLLLEMLNQTGRYYLESISGILTNNP